MTNRYTDNVSGSDSNDGLTLLTPKQNLHAHTGTNGDVHYIKGTNVPYNRDSSSFVLDWTALDGVHILRWPGYDKPIITHTNGLGFGRAIGVGAGGPAMNIVEGLIIQDTTDGGIGSIGATGANLTVLDCELYNIGLGQDSISLGGGISIGSTNAIESLIVRNCVIENTGRPNIYGNVTGEFEVGYCSLHNPGVAAPEDNTGDNVQSAQAPALYWVHHNVMTHQKNSKHLIQQSGGTTGLALIEFNDLTGPLGVGDTHKSIYLEMPYRVLSNRIHTGGFAMNLKAGGLVVGNGILINGPGAWGSNQGSILIENDLDTTCDIDHNTIILLSDGSGAYSAISTYFDDTKGTGRIRNNIILGAWTAGIRRHSTAWSESYNCIHGATTPVKDESLGTLSNGTGTITTDPMVDNEFLPSLVSPVIGTGTPISGYTDLKNIRYTALPTMGCREVKRRLS